MWCKIDEFPIRLSFLLIIILVLNVTFSAPFPWIFSLNIHNHHHNKNRNSTAIWFLLNYDNLQFVNDCVENKETIINANLSEIKFYYLYLPNSLGIKPTYYYINMLHDYLLKRNFYWHIAFMQRPAVIYVSVDMTSWWTSGSL